MHRRLLTLFFCLLAVTAATRVHAASSTATPPIAVDHPNQGIYCAVTNLGKDAIDVRVDIIGQTGAAVSGSTHVALAPGATGSGGSASPDINGFVYCRAAGFSSERIHLTACVTTIAAVAAGTPDCLSSTTAR